MIRISSEQELLDSFRLLDRDEVQLPKDLSFPLLVKDYLNWMDPSGHRTYLVFTEPGRKNALGIVFRRDHGGGGAATMCEWCHSIRSGGEVGLLTATASSNRRVGIHLCSDLSCKQKLEESPGVDDLPLGISAHERLRKIIQRMSSFTRQNLF